MAKKDKKDKQSGGTGYYNTPSGSGGMPPLQGPGEKRPSGGTGYYGGAGGYQTPAPISQGAKTQHDGAEVSQSSSTMAEGVGGGEGDQRANIQALIGRTVDRYRIYKLLGEGGFGAVYKAEHTLMKRDVAFKTLHRDLGKDPAVLHRFKKEGQVASRFRHKNAIELFDFGQMDDGTYFMAMEFLPGKDLRDYVKKQGALELALTFDVMIQTLAALQAAHDGGVIHRDLKPDNIKLEEREGRNNFVKVLDFGIAKIIDKKATDAEAQLDNQTGKMTENEAGEIVQGLGQIKPEEVDTSYKTQVGAFFGTPEYGSPEQCAGEEIDARSDLYTMGVILYECLTGTLPFVSKTPQGYLAQHMVAPPRPISEVNPNLKIPPEVEAIVMKSLEKRREDRYQTANEFAEALVDCARKCGIPITVEAGGPVVIKTPAWKLALFIGGPVLTVAAAALIWINYYMKDPLLEKAESYVQDLVTVKKAYDEALTYLKDPQTLETLAKYPEFFSRQTPVVEDLIKSREQNIQNELAEVKKAYDDVKLEDREYDPHIGRLQAVLAREEVAAAPASSRKPLDEKIAAIQRERDRDARAFWKEYEGKVDALVEALEFEKASQLCYDFPKKFASANQGQQQSAAAAKRADVERIKSTEAPKLQAAFDALAAAEKYRRDKPEDWPGQIREFQSVATAHGTNKIGLRARTEWLPRIREDWEKAAAAALAPYAEAASKAKAAPSFEALINAYEKLRDEYPEVHRNNAELAATKERGAILADLLVTSKKTFEEHRAQAQSLRDDFQPAKSLQLVEPWTRFRPDATIQAAARRLVLTYDRVLAVHQGMVLIPASDSVQVGEPKIDSPYGPIQAKQAVAAFYIDETETTNAQYLDYLEDFCDGDVKKIAAMAPEWWAGPRPPPAQMNHPVRGITIEDAKAYARWAAKEIPTEVQWEYAARGASPYLANGKTPRLYSWGEKSEMEWKQYGRFREDLEKAGRGGLPYEEWARLERQDPGTAEVKKYELGRSDPFLLWDLAGNVSEYTTSGFTRYAGSEAYEQWGPHRVVTRGGSYLTRATGKGLKPFMVRCTNRLPVRIEEAPLDVGFRCVKPVR